MGVSSSEASELLKCSGLFWKLPRGSRPAEYTNSYTICGEPKKLTVSYTSETRNQSEKETENIHVDSDYVLTIVDGRDCCWDDLTSTIRHGDRDRKV